MQAGQRPGRTCTRARRLCPAFMPAAICVLLFLLAGLGAQARQEEPLPGSPVVGLPPQSSPDVPVPDPGEFTAQTFAENLEVPWSLVFLPDGRALVTERPGRVRLIEDGKLREEPYARISVADTGEGGLMGLAVHPDFPGQPYLYVMYTYREGVNLYNRVERLRDTGDSLLPDRVIVDRIPGARVHDGGRIAFGPDRMLYVCTGDARKPERAQDVKDLGGKILRYTPDGGVPKDNPFEASPVFAFGFRNPQGLAWDPETGALFASDHGPSGEFGLFGNDAVRLVRKGGNHGWPVVLGDVNIIPYVDPVVLWTRATPPAGMAFFGGKLYVATLKSEALVSIGFRQEGARYQAASIRRLFARGPAKGRYGRIRDVVVGPDKALYLLTSNLDGRGTPRKGDDRIVRLAPK